jgi:hypothetical protein
MLMAADSDTRNRILVRLQVPEGFGWAEVRATSKRFGRFGIGFTINGRAETFIGE